MFEWHEEETGELFTNEQIDNAVEQMHNDDLFMSNMINRFGEFIEECGNK